VDEPDVPQISRDELVTRLNDPTLTIVNVLAHAAWVEKRIPRSMSLPLADIPRRAIWQLPNKDADIAVYCASPT
jgi:rhodanese-related sulfurtransferase